MIGWIAILCVMVYAAIKYASIKKRLKYFEDHGIAHVKPTFIFGNMVPCIMQKKHLYHILREYGEKFQSDKYFGFFEFLKPVVVITDADLVKEIGVRNFGNFMNRMELNFDVLDLDIFMLLGFITGDDWLKIRAQSDMFFTKAKSIDFFPYLMEHVDFLLKHCENVFNDKISISQNGLYEENASVLTRNLAIGIIASQLYGGDFNTFENENSKLISQIRKYADSMNSSKVAMTMLGWILAPKLMAKFKLRVLPLHETNCLFDAFSKAVEKRQMENNHRADFCQTVVDLINKISQKDSSEYTLTKQEFENLLHKVKTQALVIILGGVDTLSSISSSLLYELTKNSEVQSKLREEIDSITAQHGEYPSWEVIGHMRYLEMVVAETLRKWPQTFEALHRCCNIETLIDAPREGAKPYVVRKGDEVWLSTVGLHYNKKYWENPEIFDPERFNEVNRSKIYPNSYIPFGIGPRICIGFRLVPLILKSMSFHLLAKYELVQTKNFNKKLDYAIDSFSLKPETCNIGIRKRLSL